MSFKNSDTNKWIKNIVFVEFIHQKNMRANEDMKIDTEFEMSSVYVWCLTNIKIWVSLGKQVKNKNRFTELMLNNKIGGNVT